MGAGPRDVLSAQPRAAQCLPAPSEVQFSVRPGFWRFIQTALLRLLEPPPCCFKPLLKSQRECRFCCRPELVLKPADLSHNRSHRRCSALT